MAGEAKRSMPRQRSTRVNRQAARRELGRLSKHLLAPKTVALYLKAINLFRLWLCSEDIPWPQHAEDLDDILQDYAEHCWAEGDTKADFGNLLSGLSHPVTGVARAAQFIKGAWKIYGLWAYLEKRDRCLPLTPKTCRALAGQTVVQSGTTLPSLSFGLVSTIPSLIAN